MSTSSNPKLPDFITVDVNNLHAIENSPLRKISTPFEFPLSTNDKLSLKMLEMKFYSTSNMAGLALPQIGISKRGFIIAKDCDNDEDSPIQGTIFLNPRYEKLDDTKEEDYESCFSVIDTVAPVSRYKNISYSAYNADGEEMSAQASGLAARVFQHENDHLDGKLFIDNVPREKYMTLNQYLSQIS